MGFPGLSYLAKPSFILTIGSLIRILIILYSFVLDKIWQLKYTDYDYKVFSDAAQCVLQGQSPYDRITYRYTPLLAYMMLPNFLLFYEFGKILFASFDIIAAILLGKILDKYGEESKNKTYAVALWVLYPLSIIISTRGSADSLIVMLSLLALYLIICEKYILGAVVFGLAVHFKIYPIIYAVPLFLFIDAKNDNESKTTIFGWIWNKFWNKERLRFAIISAGVFLGLNYLFYKIYGYKFLFEAYLYHFVRKDHRHNMSMYFNSVHLFYDSEYGQKIGLIGFIPQWAMILLFGVSLHRDIGTCLFFQSFLFVIYNKVCTAQYFVWFMGLLPLLAPRNLIWLKNKILFIGLWLAWWFSQGGVLYNAYKLEHLGENSFQELFWSNLMFFITSAGLICYLLINQQIVDVWKIQKIKKD